MKSEISYEKIKSDFGNINEFKKALKQSGLDEKKYQKLLDNIDIELDSHLTGGGNIKKNIKLNGGGESLENINELIGFFKILNENSSVEANSKIKEIINKLKELKKYIERKPITSVLKLNILQSLMFPPIPTSADSQPGTPDSETSGQDSQLGTPASKLDSQPGTAQAQSVSAQATTQAPAQAATQATTQAQSVPAPTNIAQVEQQVKEKAEQEARDAAEKFKDINPIIYNIAFMQNSIFDDKKFLQWNKGRIGLKKEK